MKKAITVLLFVAMGAAGFFGWWYWQAGDSSEQLESDTTSKHTGASAIPSSMERQELHAGEITFEINSQTWKTAEGGYYSKESGLCGQGVTATIPAKCLDYKMLIPAGETFLNPDQFHVDISVFENAVPLSPGKWLHEIAAVDGVNPKITSLSINGMEAYRQEVNYGPDHVRLWYGIVTEGYGILLHTTLFNGNHASYKGGVNYLDRIAEVDAIALSVTRRE